MAQQVITMKNGETQAARIAAYDLTQISVSGGRVKHYRVREGVLMVKKDEDMGVIFVQPESAYVNQTISIFIIDDKGQTYTLLLRPERVPAESVVISGIEVDSKEALVWEKSRPYVASLTSVVRHMAMRKAPPGYKEVKVNKEIPRWKEARFFLKSEYQGSTLRGLHYVLKNVDKREMRVIENELYTKGTLAVSVEKHILAPGQHTDVYIVMDGNK